LQRISPIIGQYGKVESSDLVTDANTRAAGFELQASKKSDLMRPYIDQGLTAIQLIPNIEVPFESMDARLQEFLIAAAGLSRKSLNHLSPSTVEKIIRDILPLDSLTDPDTQSDLLYRFLLTSGDSLGGSMRNIIGDIGQDRLVSLLERHMSLNKIDYQIHQSASGKVSSLNWKDQTIHFNKKPKFVGKSIDIIFLRSDGELENPDSYLACGELKSGIDPAGADEHWKTAKSALARIRDNFVSSNMTPPYLFFVGAAIEKAMAQEAVQMMKSGTLNLAVNLYKDRQVAKLIEELLALR
jgi:hypothetical protein